MERISRRDLLGRGTKLSIAGGAVALASGSLVTACGSTLDAAGADDVVPYTGAHQAGITTPAPGRLVYAAYDVTTRRHTDVQKLLRRWTAAIALLTRGRPVGAIEPENTRDAPADTGEAIGSSAARLTITVGFGRSLFHDGEPRFGIYDKVPPQLAALPAFKGEALDPARSGGDIAVQVCADDPQTAFHAFHTLTRLALGTARVRWMQVGFGRASSTSAPHTTPRNLMGFKDGTNNITAQESAALDEHVWVGEDDKPAWMRGGTFVVVRRIRIHLEAWDRSSLKEQQETIGRTKLEGAPLTGTQERDTPDLARLPPHAHIRLAAPSENGGIRMLRRGYNFTDGVDPRTGQLDAGLFFIAYQRDPRHQFVPLQHRLGAADALNEYIVHDASAVFAVPPGIGPGTYIGETLWG